MLKNCALTMLTAGCVLLLYEDYTIFSVMTGKPPCLLTLTKAETLSRDQKTLVSKFSNKTVLILHILLIFLQVKSQWNSIIFLLSNDQL